MGGDKARKRNDKWKIEGDSHFTSSWVSDLSMIWLFFWWEWGGKIKALI